MNLLKMPFHQIQQKIFAKSNNTKDKPCHLTSFTMSEIIEMIGNGMCAYTGKEFKDFQDITFERVNPKLGYVSGNVLIVSREANRSKSQLDAFVKHPCINSQMKIKLLRKALYQLEKENGKNISAPSNGETHHLS